MLANFGSPLDLKLRLCRFEESPCLRDVSARGESIRSCRAPEEWFLSASLSAFLLEPSRLAILF